MLFKNHNTTEKKPIPEGTTEDLKFGFSLMWWKKPQNRNRAFSIGG